MVRILRTSVTTNKGITMEVSIEETKQDEMNKLAKRMKSLRKSFNKAREQYIAHLPDATDEQMATIVSKLTAYDPSAKDGVNTKFKLSLEQQGEIELALVDVENSLNTDEGRQMVADYLAKAERIKSFHIGKPKKTGEDKDKITVRASWVC
jgi:hypothetical protein